MTWLIALLVFVPAGYFVVDGLHALIRGSYIAPRKGPHAGRLGPWAGLVRAAGLDPESVAFRGFFLVYGVAWLCALATFLAGVAWGKTALLLFAAGSLWYLPAGTALGLLQILLLLWR